MQTLGKSYRWQDYKVWDYPSLSLPPQSELWPATCHSPFVFILGGFHAPNMGAAFGGVAYKHFSDSSDPGHTSYASENNVAGGFLNPSCLACLVQGYHPPSGCNQCPPSAPPQTSWEAAAVGKYLRRSLTGPPDSLGQVLVAIGLVTCILSQVLAPAQFFILPWNLQGLFLLVYCSHHCQGLSASCRGAAGWSRYHPSVSQKNLGSFVIQLGWCSQRIFPGFSFLPLNCISCLSLPDLWLNSIW